MCVKVRFAPYSCVHDDQYAEDEDDAVVPAADTKDPKLPKRTPSSLSLVEEEEEHASDVPVLTSTQRYVDKFIQIDATGANSPRETHQCTYKVEQEGARIRRHTLYSRPKWTCRPSLVCDSIL